ncbi:nuclease-related domain-containing protein [Alkalihalophilus lindianensis]|uniref:Nuclease-related domain-containing protein n=1 Tax=Alkalihalophilus lindianensis TaxID=1630542 RepID=A0ABU3X9J4_9BACI|nr:nuclease-related domain-containing protein [Alkalihalophilus lindianensis]MDV2684478.1 nuclease-related domain-containing protein [Alkalihalophilus lindianensis]
MIAKPRKIPVHIAKLEALLRRMPSHHPKRPQIEADLAKRRAGYKGESALDYHLSFLPHKEYVIFHDLRLQSGDYYFQIDTLILTPNYILLIEVKHLFGTLTFEPEFQQLVRSTADAEDVFPDPIIQVKRQASQLKELLKDHKFPDIPIETIVVITNSLSRITTSQTTDYLRRYIIRDTVLVSRILKLTTQHHTLIYPPKLIKKAIRILNKSHSPTTFDPLISYNLQEEDLVKGVHCPKCFAIPMRRLHGKWLCTFCYHQSGMAHIHSLIDYEVLIKNSITNKQACKFLRVHPPLAKRLLTSLHFPQIGATKSRVYLINIDQLYEAAQKEDSD